MPTPIVTRKDLTAKFQGIVQVPLFEAPYTLPANAGWLFQQSSWWPTLSAQSISGLGNVTGLETILLTPFVFSTVTFPKATTSFGAFNSARRTLFFADTLFNWVGAVTKVKAWSLNAVLGINTFSSSLNPNFLIFDNTIAGEVNYLFSLSGGPYLFSANLSPAFGGLANNVISDALAMCAVGYVAPGISFIPFLINITLQARSYAYNVPDFLTDNNWLRVQQDATLPDVNFVGFNPGIVGGQTAGWNRLFFEQSDLDALFNITTTPLALGLYQGFVHGHIAWSPGINQYTPSQNGSVVIYSLDASKYWLINFVPFSAKAGQMLAASASAWRVTIDPNGIFYVGTSVDNRTVLTSFGLNLPWSVPTAKLPGIGFPCQGECRPIPLQLDKL